MMIQDVKIGISEIQSLQSKHSSELKLRESFQITCNNLKKGNDSNLKILYFNFYGIYLL